MLKNALAETNPVLIIERGDVKINPYEHPRPITIDQFNDTLYAIVKSILGKRDRTVFVLLYRYGLRRSEVFNLPGKDISFANGKVFFKATPKGGWSAKKETPQPVWALITEHLTAY